MAQGFGNAGDFAFATWTAVTGADVRSITAGPGWSRAIGDLTSLDASDGDLRTKIASGRLEPKPITAEIFFDPASGGTDEPPITAQNLTLTYPTGNSTFVMSAYCSDWQMAGMIDDEIMIAEAEFTLAGGVALDEVTAA